MKGNVLLIPIRILKKAKHIKKNWSKTHCAFVVAVWVLNILSQSSRKQMGHNSTLIHDLRWDLLTSIRTSIQVLGSYCIVVIDRELVDATAWYRNFLLWLLLKNMYVKAGQDRGNRLAHIRPESTYSLRSTKQGVQVCTFHNMVVTNTSGYQMAQNQFTNLLPLDFYIHIE